MDLATSTTLWRTFNLFIGYHALGPQTSLPYTLITLNS